MSKGVYPRKKRPINPPCACGKPFLARGMCRACYSKWWKTVISPEKLEERRSGDAARTREWWKALSPEEKRAVGRRNILRRYGLTPDDFMRMMQEQGGKCAICGVPPAAGECLEIDHDHGCCDGRLARSRASCGKCVRGLIHHRCNTLLVAIENEEFLRQAIAYLKSWEHNLKRRFGS